MITPDKTFPHLEMSFGLSESIVIWDRPDPPASDATVFWNYAGNSPSLLRIAEDNRGLLCRTLLEWFAGIHASLALNIDKEREGQDSRLHQLSSSIVNRRNPWTIERFADLVRVSALDLIIRQSNISAIHYEGSNRETAYLISQCCRAHRVYFTSSIPQLRTDRMALASQIEKRIRHSPALRLLVFLLRRRGLVSLRPREIPDNHVLLAAPLAHLDSQIAHTSYIQSGYWKSLPETLDTDGRRVLTLHWISQNSIRHPTRVPSVVAEHHNSILLDSFLDVRTIGRAVKSWITNYWYLRRKIKLLLNKAPEVCPRFVITHLKGDLKRTVYGDLALEHSLQREMVKAFACRVSQLTHVVIASENFPIERDLLDALKPKTTGNFVLFAHGGVRPWDLKYARNSRNLSLHRALLSPVDRDVLLAINGEIDRMNLMEMTDDLEHVVDVEALRFLSLAKPRLREQEITVQATTEPLRLLILGDYLPSPTLRVCQVVEEALPTLGVETTLMFRPHPLTVSRDKDAMRGKGAIASGSLVEDLSQADVVVSTSSSSSGLGALLAGKTVITLVNSSDLNYFPEVTGVTFVRDARQLAEALVARRNPPPPDHEVGLHLDPDLSRWLKLLSS